MTGMKMPGGTSVAPGREMLAPRMCRSTNRQSDPEAWFRIVHLAQDPDNGAPMTAYREQTVEITLGPKGAFESLAMTLTIHPIRIPAKTHW